MAKKRDRLKIIYDILKVIREKNGKIKPTHILYKSNLSSQMLGEYLTEMIDGGFIIENMIERTKTYSLTQKGYEYLNKYSFIAEFMESFGLNENEES